MSTGQVGTGGVNNPAVTGAGIDINAEYQAIAQRFIYANEALQAFALEAVDRVQGKDNHKVLNHLTNDQIMSFFEKTYIEYLSTDLPKWQYAVQNKIGDMNTNIQVLNNLTRAASMVQEFKGYIYGAGYRPSQPQSYMNIYNQNVVPMNGRYNMPNNNLQNLGDSSTAINPALANPGGKFSNTFGIGNMYS